MADVFISYAREDRPFAARLAHRLEAGGRSVWWDREILPGKDFAELIAAELARAKAVVVIWSAGLEQVGLGARRGARGAGARGAGAGAGRCHRAADRLPLDPCGRPDRLGGRASIPGSTDLELAIDALRTGVPVPDRAEPEPEPAASPGRGWAALGGRGGPGAGAPSPGCSWRCPR